MQVPGHSKKTKKQKKSNKNGWESSGRMGGVWAKIDTVADSCLSAKFDFAFKGVVHFKLLLPRNIWPKRRAKGEKGWAKKRKLFKLVMNRTAKAKRKKYQGGKFMEDKMDTEKAVLKLKTLKKRVPV